MLNVLVFYGGKSVEHDVSIITGIQVIENIDKTKYNAIPIYITREGEFVLPDNYNDVNTYSHLLKRYKKVFFHLGQRKISLKGVLTKTIKVYAAIVCCHGVNGEDGSLSGLLRLADIPFSCADVLSSAICMDKIIMKDVFKANNFPCVPYVWITRHKFEDNQQKFIESAEQLGYPLVVKPSNLGSSIGISVCKNNKQLVDAVNLAFMYDSRVIVEKCIQNLREINCSCMGDWECELSCLEEPKGWTEFLDFNEKYINHKKDQTKRKINPELNIRLKEQIYELSQKAFEIFCCSGVVRIDYMLDTETNNIYINEINTIPGSMAFYLWKDKNVSFKLLIDKLINIAVSKHFNLINNNYSYKSDVLKNFSQNSINKYSTKKLNNE